MAESRMSSITDTGVRDALRIRSSILGKPLIGPKSVNIHIINSCNYKCEFCWYFSPLVKDQPQRKLLDYEVLEGVLEDCREIGVDEINFEGGEVTLYPYWERAFCKVKELGMRLIAYSHLGFAADHLPGLCFADQLTVNFSAMTEESFKRVHGKHTSMERVLHNLDLLLAMRSKRGKPQIVLSFVVYDHNYQELGAFLNMAHQRRIDKVVVRFFKATQEMKDLVFSQEGLASLFHTVDEALRTPYGFRHDLKHLHHILQSGQVLRNVDSLSRSPMHNDRLLFYDTTGGSIHCHVGWFYANIDEKGRVVAPCDNVGVCVAGNVNERRFKDIWFDNDFLHDTLKEAARGIHTCSSKWKECRYCSYVPINKMLDEKVRRAAAGGV
ncbi:MAG: radical SAM protein [Candidatus Omnitrophica bacterium]|nr:radical SAM protein [Candidatus Omnitrophota bacterium]MDE2008564.1 radical SAM protein [Candidatus Omnitrophota bacterium]MDE2214030.1 radical SAM protein [Candidatus Omnitrophota bacterium]MDE2230992.1 radical SAM protein [Candidatus Omnitrophota bacterium]